METEKLRDALQSAGVTQYEADAYIALLERGTASAVEVSDASGVPQARIYDVLRNLAEKGYVETYQQGTLKARANDPQVVIEDLRDHATTVTAAADEIVDRWEEPDVEDSKISVVSQPRTVFERAEDWIESADNEIQICMTPRQFEDFEPSLRAAYERGVVIKLTITPEGESDPPLSEFTDRFEGCVSEVRYRDLLTPFVLLVDRTDVCYAPETSLPTTSQYGVIVQDYSLSRIFDWFFQTAVWNNWEVVYSDRTGELPAVFTNIRECIRHIKQPFDDGHRIVLSVEGHFRDGGDGVALTGTVSDVTYASDSFDPESTSLQTFVDVATIELETDDGTYEIGGWGALYEDIEAERFVVELID